MQKRASRKDFRLRLQEMIRSLRQDIMSGALETGSYLPAERDLEVRFGLSNASVRNGLQMLVEEGWIEKIPRVGNRIIRPSSEAKTTIKFGYVSAISGIVGMDELLREFASQYPHIEVQSLELPSGSYSMALKEYMESGILDVVLINNNNFQDFVENSCTGLLEPLEPKEDISSFLTDPFRQGSNTLIQPFVYSPVVLCYNKTHFEQSGVPVPDSSWTWSELFRYGQQLAVPNERFGFYFYLPSRNRWPIFMLQSGSVFRSDEQGHYRLRGGKIVESLAACRDLLARTDVFPRLLSESDADAEALFLQEKVSVIMTTYFFLNQLRGSKIAFDVSPLPGGLHDSSTLMIINGLAVNSRSPRKEAAKRLVDFLTSYETQLTLRRTTLNIAAHRRAMDWEGEESVYRPPRFRMYREIYPTCRLITELGLTNLQLKEMQREVLLFLSGLQDRDTFGESLEQVLREAGRKSRLGTALE